MNGKERNVMAAPRKSTAASEINVMRVAGAWAKSLPGYNAKITAWCEAALTDSRGGVVSVVLADDALLRDLNHTYRGKNKPTNVLSFLGENDELGDVMLALETVKGEAREQRKSFAAHTAHLVVHGCLHLMGHDHEKPREAQNMEAREVEILGKLGFPNPYAGAK